MLYAEWEPTRALPGELSLPVGSYDVRIFLTEESFHESAAPPSSGRWATVMTHDDLQFAITPPPECSDGADNDGDGRIDFDPVTFANPGDQHTPPAGSGDPACVDPIAVMENPACQDGINNDPGQDTQGLIDCDGGQSIWGYCTSVPGGCPANVSDPDGDGVANPDPQCIDTPWKNREARPSSCGLGTELALLPAHADVDVAKAAVVGTSQMA